MKPPQTVAILPKVASEGTTMPTVTRKMRISEAVPRLLEIMAALRAAYPDRKFTLDGRLVGDLGEVLAAEHYDIELLPE